VEVVQDLESLIKSHKKTISIGIDDEFVEEIIESDNEQRYVAYIKPTFYALVL
jgi:hypothetical protein